VSVFGLGTSVAITDGGSHQKVEPKEIKKSHSDSCPDFQTVERLDQAQKARRRKMSQQVAKNFTRLTLVLVIAFGSAVISANAQSSTRVVADIPFEFIVADKTLPSGNYEVRAMFDNGHGLLIRSRDGSASAMRITNPVIGHGTETKSKLVFHRYGKTYFLAQVWNGDPDGVQLRKCSRERALQKEQTNIASKTDYATQGYEIVEVVAALR